MRRCYRRLLPLQAFHSTNLHQHLRLRHRNPQLAICLPASHLPAINQPRRQLSLHLPKSPSLRLSLSVVALQATRQRLLAIRHLSPYRSLLTSLRKPVNLPRQSSPRQRHSLDSASSPLRRLRKPLRMGWNNLLRQLLVLVLERQRTALSHLSHNLRNLRPSHLAVVLLLRQRLALQLHRASTSVAPQLLLAIRLAKLAHLRLLQLPTEDSISHPMPPLLQSQKRPNLRLLLAALRLLLPPQLELRQLLHLHSDKLHLLKLNPRRLIHSAELFHRALAVLLQLLLSEVSEHLAQLLPLHSLLSASVALHPLLLTHPLHSAAPRQLNHPVLRAATVVRLLFPSAKEPVLLQVQMVNSNLELPRLLPRREDSHSAEEVSKALRGRQPQEEVRLAAVVICLT